MTIKHVGIVGAGTMGNGIAQAFAVAGIPVTMTDIGAAPASSAASRRSTGASSASSRRTR